MNLLQLYQSGSVTGTCTFPRKIPAVLWMETFMAQGQ